MSHREEAKFAIKWVTPRTDLVGRWTPHSTGTMNSNGPPFSCLESSTAAVHRMLDDGQIEVQWNMRSIAADRYFGNNSHVCHCQPIFYSSIYPSMVMLLSAMQFWINKSKWSSKFEIFEGIRGRTGVSTLRHLESTKLWNEMTLKLCYWLLKQKHRVQQVATSSGMSQSAWNIAQVTPQQLKA